MRTLPSGALQPTFRHRNGKRQIGPHNNLGMRGHRRGAGKENRPHVCPKKKVFSILADGMSLI